jgi:hypothetical protein
MWNIFRTKNSLQQEDRSSEEDAEHLIRQLRSKFEQKMKALTQDINQSE